VLIGNFALPLLIFTSIQHQVRHLEPRLNPTKK
jgi:hypothetical protein